MRAEISGIHERERYEIQRICFGLSYISHLRVVLRVLLNYQLSFLNASTRKKGGVVLVFCCKGKDSLIGETSVKIMMDNDVTLESR